MTDAEHWQLVKDLAGRAFEQAPDRRAAWLHGQDVAPAVRDAAARLLDADADADAGCFLDADPPLGSPLDPPSRSAARPGDVIGAYRIVRLIGEGGMGAVYLATRADDAFHKQVAIKLVGGGGPPRALAERLRQERRLLATLDHPSIARLLDGGTTADGAPYVVMEYVDGAPIDRYCETHRLPLRARIELVRRVCEAVHHAHGNLVVHRDIKPGNILVTADGTPKLLDFGIAKALASDETVRTITGVGAMTPESASPEQVLGQPITVATDVYALGALLYRLIAGRPPFADAASPAALLHAICERDPLPPGQAAPATTVPRDVDLIVVKALRKRPADRYDSAAALAADLGRYLAGRPVEAAPDTLGYRTRGFVARHRLATVAVVTGIVALSGGLAATLWQARIAEAERQRAERRFGEVRRLARSLIFDVHDAITPLPGSTPVRRQLVANAVQYLDGLAGESGGDADLLRELAEGYERLARVQGRSGNANLGDESGARASGAKALALRRQIVQHPAARPEDAVNLAESLQGQAGAAASAEAQATAVGEALALLDGLPTAVGEGRRAANLRASLLWSLAGAHVRAKDYPAARAPYRRSVALFEQLLASADDDTRPNASRNLSIVLKNYGALEWELGERPLALDAYRRARALDEARLALRPGDTTWLLDLSYSVASVAFTERETGAFRASLDHYREALALRERALSGDPQNAQAQAAVDRARRSIAEVEAMMASPGPPASARP